MRIDLGWLYTEHSEIQIRVVAIAAVLAAYIIFMNQVGGDGAILSLVTNTIITLAILKKGKKEKKK